MPWLLRVVLHILMHLLNSASFADMHSLGGIPWLHPLPCKGFGRTVLVVIHAHRLE